jgi:hypothetical protein
MTEKPDTRTIAQRLHAVMVAVSHVAKKDVNNHQKFNFRGIDAVVNAVGPALRAEGVVVLPEVVQSSYAVEQFGANRTNMGHVTVQVRYTFLGLQGDSVSVVSIGEATDSGDKATAKAMSVAFRTALLQTLCLPTDEPDPDYFTYERSDSVQNSVQNVQDAPKSVSGKAKVDVFTDLSQRLFAATDLASLDAVRQVIADTAANKGVLSESNLAALRVAYGERLELLKAAG